MKNEIDLPAATDLELTIENDSRVYPKRLAIEANLRRKVAREVYYPAKAVDAWMHFVDAGARLYRHDFPGVQFNRATRRCVAERFAREFEGQLAMELQAAKEGAFEEQAITHQEAAATGKYRAWQRASMAGREASKAVNVAASFTAAIKGA